MDLIYAQFNKGHLSLEAIKTILGQDQASWTVLSSMFMQDEEGLFYNERLEEAIVKRREFTEKQRNNANMRWHPSGINLENDVGMPLENENKNENKNKKQELEQGENYDQKIKQNVLPHGGDLQNFRMNKYSEIQELFRQWNVFAKKYGLPQIQTTINISPQRLLIIYHLLTDPDFDLKTTPEQVFGGIIKKNGGFYLGKQKNKFHADFDSVFREKKWVSFLEANSISDSSAKIATSIQTYSCPACNEEISITNNQIHRYNCKNQKYWEDKDREESLKYQSDTKEHPENLLEFTCDACGTQNSSFRPLVENRPNNKTKCKKCNKEFLNSFLLGKQR